MERKVVMAILLSLVFFALIVTPTGYAKDVNHNSGTVNLSGEQYWGYHMALPDGGGIKYTIKANNSVNMHLLDRANLQKYLNGQNFKYIDSGSALDVKSISIQVAINSSAGGDYYLIVESANYKSVNFTYDITYGKDVEISFLDFLGAFNGTLCLASLFLLLIWFVMLIWVYRDAKHRGKSGLLWALIVLFLNVIGLIIWLVVRPKNKI